uniref:Uncharacterized protein n=1 Tax=Photinus pyralis TaxID=7054 RepID=A0A1Y1KZ76_PHOPY
MSTLVDSQFEGVHPKSVTDLDQKRGRFIRSASIDRIMQFNLYNVCAQYYQPLPAIILWLKSSQTLIDRYITLLKAIFVLSLSYAQARTKTFVLRICPSFLVVSVYLSVLVIATQFFACLYLILNIYLPLGVVFQISCISIISFINSILSFQYLKIESKK